MSEKLPACRGFRLWATQEYSDKRYRATQDWYGAARERLRGGLIGRPLAYARGSGTGAPMLLGLIEEQK
jgi:hypothetical protein